jgi:hypothetical protein
LARLSPVSLETWQRSMSFDLLSFVHLKPDVLAPFQERPNLLHTEPVSDLYRQLRIEASFIGIRADTPLHFLREGCALSVGGVRDFLNPARIRPGRSRTARTWTASRERVRWHECEFAEHGGQVSQGFPHISD